MPQHHYFISLLLWFMLHFAQCYTVCACTVIASSLAYAEWVHCSHQHGIKQTSLHCDSSVHPHHPSNPLYSRTVKRTQFTNISRPPAHSLPIPPPVQAHSKCGIVVSWDLSCTVLSFQLAWFSPTWNEVSVLQRWEKLRSISVIIHEYDSSIDSEDSSTTELIEAKCYINQVGKIKKKKSGLGKEPMDRQKL